jgi:hypothetical protein
MPDATYFGEKPDRGRITPGRTYPNEGYAVLRCGNTEVVLGYSLLHHLRFEEDAASPAWAQIAEANRALASITCEASLGRTGDSPPIAPTAAEPGEGDADHA